MAISYIGESHDAVDDNASDDTVYPAVVGSTDDLLVMFVVTGGGRTVTTPSGWTLRASIMTALSIGLYCFTKVHGGEAGTYTVASGTYSAMNACVLAYRDAEYDTVNTPGEGNDTTVEEGDLSVSDDSSFAVWGLGNIAASSSHGTLNERVDDASEDGYHIAVYDEAVDSGTATGPVITLSSYERWASIGIGLKPAAGAPTFGGRNMILGGGISV